MPETAEPMTGNLYLHVECQHEGNWIPVGVALLEPNFVQSKETAAIMDAKLYHFMQGHLVDSRHLPSLRYSVSFISSDKPPPVEGREIDLAELYSPGVFYVA